MGVASGALSPPAEWQHKAVPPPRPMQVHGEAVHRRCGCHNHGIKQPGKAHKELHLLCRLAPLPTAYPTSFSRAAAATVREPRAHTQESPSWVAGAAGEGDWPRREGLKEEDGGKQ